MEIILKGSKNSGTEKYNIRNEKFTRWRLESIFEKAKEKNH